jgi:CPA1 family monovalent cation:H+ antiporter
MPSLGALVVLGWTGMRGIVSLATALALPLTLANGQPFQERPLIIFLAYAVILLTLVIPTLTLPALLRYVRLGEQDEREQEEIRARLAMARAATDQIARLRAEATFSEAVLNEIARRYERQLNRMAPNLETNASSSIVPSEQQSRALMLELFEAERRVIHELRSRGELYDEVYHQLGEELDLESLRVRRNMRPI